MAAARIRHPLNPDSEVHLRPLSELAGLQRVRLTLARIPPGKESFAYHAHEADEEFVYILSGRGRAEIGDRDGRGRSRRLHGLRHPLGRPPPGQPV